MKGYARRRDILLMASEDRVPGAGRMPIIAAYMLVSQGAVSILMRSISFHDDILTTERVAAKGGER